MYNSTEATALEIFSQSYLWVLCTIGVPANTLAIVVVLSMQRMTPATLLIAALAFFDGSALVSKLVYQKVDSTNNVYCKLDFLSFFFSTMANWILMYICLERFIAVCYPLKKLYLVTISRTCILFIMTSVVFLSYLLPVYTVIPYYYKGSCVIDSVHVKFWRYYHSFICEMLILIVPYITVTFLTAAIVIKLKLYSRERRKALERTSSASNSNNQKVLEENERTERSLTIMLTFTALFFILFTLPSFIHFIMNKAEVHNEVFFQIKYFLFDATHALNFFMYFLTAGRFRQRCHQLLCCGDLLKSDRSDRSKKSDAGDESMSLSTMVTTT